MAPPEGVRYSCRRCPASRSVAWRRRRSTTRGSCSPCRRVPPPGIGSARTRNQAQAALPAMLNTLNGGELRRATASPDLASFVATSASTPPGGRLVDWLRSCGSRDRTPPAIARRRAIDRLRSSPFPPRVRSPVSAIGLSKSPRTLVHCSNYTTWSTLSSAATPVSPGTLNPGPPALPNARGPKNEARTPRAAGSRPPGSLA